MKRVLSCSLAFILSGPAALPQAPAGGDADLEAAIRLLNEGQLQVGLLGLDALITRLESQNTSDSKTLVRALVYKGVALVGLAQEQPARASFREALRYDPTLRLSDNEFPPRVVRIFEATRTGKAGSALEPPSGVPKKAGLGAVGGALIVVGALAVGGTAVVKGGGSNQPVASASSPPLAVGVAPDGQAIPGVTVMTLSVTGGNLGSAVPTWSFGDGSQVTGRQVTHVYDREGSFTPVLNVGSDMAAGRTITARSLTGRWRDPNGVFYDFSQNGTSLSGRLTSDRGVVANSLGTVTNPRHVEWADNFTHGGQSTYSGDVSADLNTMTVTHTGGGGSGSFALVRE